MRKLLTLNKEGKLSLRAADGVDTEIQLTLREAWQEQRLNTPKMVL